MLTIRTKSDQGAKDSSAKQDRSALLRPVSSLVRFYQEAAVQPPHVDAQRQKQEEYDQCLAAANNLREVKALRAELGSKKDPDPEPAYKDVKHVNGGERKLLDAFSREEQEKQDEQLARMIAMEEKGGLRLKENSLVDNKTYNLALKELDKGGLYNDNADRNRNRLISMLNDSSVEDRATIINVLASLNKAKILNQSSFDLLYGKRASLHKIFLAMTYFTELKALTANVFKCLLVNVESLPNDPSETYYNAIIERVSSVTPRSNFFNNLFRSQLIDTDLLKISFIKESKSVPR